MKSRLVGEVRQLVWLFLSEVLLVGGFILLPQWSNAQTLNHPPELMPLTNWVVGERRMVTLTNVASDVDVPPQVLTFGLGPGIPDGVTIDPATGVFHWRPSEIQGGTTNLFEIIVTDDGVPSLSATQRFQIIVRDTLPDFALSIGSTNLLLNETGSVHVLFSTRVPVTNMSFTLSIDTQRLREVSFTPRPGNNSTIQFSPAGPDAFAGLVLADVGNPLQGTADLGALSFAVADQSDSAIVSLDVTQLSGIRLDGNRVGYTAANSGRVFVVINEPLLDIDAFALGQVRVYRLPNFTASLLWADPAASPWVWYKLTDFVARPFKTVEVVNDPGIASGRVYRLRVPRAP